MSIKRNIAVLAMLFSVSVSATDVEEQQPTVLKIPTAVAVKSGYKLYPIALVCPYNIRTTWPNENVTPVLVPRSNPVIPLFLVMAMSLRARSSYIGFSLFSWEKSENGIGLTVPACR